MKRLILITRSIVTSFLTLVLFFSFTLVAFAAESTLTYKAEFRPNDVMPIVEKAGGNKIFLEGYKVTSIEQAVKNLKLNVTLPDSYLESSKQTKSIKVSMSCGKNEFIFRVNPSESFRKTRKLDDGTNFIWGCLSGTTDLKMLGDTNTTISYYLIPDKDLCYYGVSFEETDKHPMMQLSFGNLEPTAELLDIVQTKEKDEMIQDNNEKVATALSISGDFYDKGRSYGTYLNGANQKKEMNVISASAVCSVNNYLSGNEHVRTWGRLDNVKSIYIQSLYTCWIAGANIRLYSNDSRRNVLYINGVNPPDRNNSGTIPTIVWDIINYAGVPTATIEAKANSLLIDSLTTSGLGSYDCMRTFQGSIDSNKASLPNSIKYNNADKGVKGSTSGVDAYFGYNFNTTNNSKLKLYPQAKMLYAIRYSTNWPNYWWTNYAGVQHTVN